MSTKTDMTTSSTQLTTGEVYGAENLTQDDLMIPKLHIVQDMSKYYRDLGCEVGQIVNSLTNESVGDKVEIIPLSLAQFWGEPAKNRGSGARGRRYLLNSDNVNAQWGDFMDEEGVPRRRRKEHDWLCLLPSDVEGLPVSITFRDTSFTAAKKLNTFAMLNKKLNKPCYASAYELIAQETTNDQGTFYVFTIGKKRVATQEEMDAAKIWAQTLSSRQVTTDTKEDDAPY